MSEDVSVIGPDLTRSTDSQGKVVVSFNVSTHTLPGDNWKIAAYLDGQTSPTQAQVDAGTVPAHVVLSSRLTLWRRLWIEQDTMSAVPWEGEESNWLTGDNATYADATAGGVVKTFVDLGQEVPVDFAEQDQFQRGLYMAGNQFYDVRSSTGRTIKVSGNPDPEGDGEPRSYSLHDDDDNFLLPRLGNIGIGGYVNEFARAYITVKWLDVGGSRVPFVRNHSTGRLTNMGDGTWNNFHEFPTSRDFWTGLVVVGFQPEASYDYDPDSPPAILGMCRSEVYSVYNEAMVFLETIRDRGAADLAHVTAHEICHMVDTGDNECTSGCIMWVDQNSGLLGEQFCDKCLKAMRGAPTF